MVPISSFYYPLLINSLNLPFGMWWNIHGFLSRLDLLVGGIGWYLYTKGRAQELKQTKHTHTHTHTKQTKKRKEMEEPLFSVS